MASHSWDSNDYEVIQESFLSGGIDDNLIEDSRGDAEYDEDEEEEVIDPPCECCDECEVSGFSETECECIKCRSCDECENSCEVGFCEECHHHEDECDCDKYCECCEVCETAEWRESECECAQCETCFACENSCDVAKCAKCFSHIVDGICLNCSVFNRLNGEGDRLPDRAKVLMAPKRAFRSWSKSEKSIMRSLFTSGMSLAEIAAHLDRTENAVVVQLANLGLLSEVDLSNAVHKAQERYRRATQPDPETPF